jgi:hypothetical protein
MERVTTCWEQIQRSTPMGTPHTSGRQSDRADPFSALSSGPTGCPARAVPGAATGASTVAPHPTARGRGITLGSQHFGCHRPRLEHRTSRQNDGHRQPDIGAERHFSRAFGALSVHAESRARPSLAAGYVPQCLGLSRWHACCRTHLSLVAAPAGDIPSETAKYWPIKSLKCGCPPQGCDSRPGRNPGVTDC